MGQFAWTVEPEGKTHGADAAIHIKLHVVELEQALDVLLTHRRQNQRTDHGQPHLSAVRVSGEHKVNQREPRMLDDGIGVVRLVAHQDDRPFGICGYGKVQVGAAGSGVVGPAEEEAVLASLQLNEAIDQHGDSMGLQRSDHVIGAHGDVMISQDGVAVRRLEAGKDFSAEPSRTPGHQARQWTTAHEVTGDQYDLRGESIYLLDHLFHEPGFGVLLEMEVTHLDDLQPHEGVGKLAESEGAVGDLILVPGVGSGVGSQAQTCGGGSKHEVAAGDQVGSQMAATARNGVHSP